MKASYLQQKTTMCTVFLILLLSVVGMREMYAQSFSEGVLKYALNDDGVSVTVVGHVDSVWAQGSLYIPESVRYQDQEYTVTQIGTEAFYQCYYLSGELVLPNTITTIAPRAFYYCPGLSGTLNIPNSVTSIGEEAFFFCEGFTGDLVIPESITEIEKGTFNVCRGFSGLVLPNTITKIGDWAFCECPNMTGNLILPDHLKEIGQSAFLLCDFTGDLVFPNSLKTIGPAAFSYNSGIQNISIPSSVTSIAGCPFLGTAWFYNQPDGVVYLDKCCLGYKIGDDLGYGYVNDSFLALSPDTRLIADYAFADVTSSGSLTIPNSVQIIGKGAFYYCYDYGSGGSLTIGSSVAIIGDEAFAGCVFQGGWLYIPDNVVRIGKNAFSGCKFGGALRISNSLTKIEDGVFSDCNFSGTLSIPNNVTTIGNGAFSGCSGFSGNLTIDHSVTTIGDGAFSGCSGINGKLTIGSSVSSIGAQAFFNCPGFTSIQVKEGNAFYDSRDNCNALIETSTDKLVLGCKNTIIPSNVVTIGDAAFYNCRELSSIDVPNSVSTIGNLAFFNCRELSSVEIPNSVSAIGSSAFSRCYGLSSIEIPESVVSIGEGAFSMCKNLTKVLFDAPACDNADGMYHWNLSPPFARCTGILKIGSNVEAIPAFLFRYTDFQKVIIPESVCAIGDSAFAYSSSINSMTSMNAVPPQLGEDVFLEVRRNIPIKVPCDSKEAYLSTSGWDEFENYEGEFPYNLSVSTDAPGYCILNILERPSCESNQVTVEAIARTGYKFIAWMEDGEEVSREAVYSFALDRDRDLVAHLISNHGCEESLSQSVTIGPNPTNGQVRIEAEDIKRIIIVNLLGQYVFESNVSGNVFEYCFDGQDAGVYVICVETANGMATKRLTVVR